MKSEVIAFLTCLLVLCAQGQLANRSSKCKCMNSYISRVNPVLIRTEPVVHYPSIFCPNTEIIVKIANMEKCVKPQSPLGKLILQNMNKRNKKGAVSTTTASTQTNTWSSTTVHTTAKLL